MVACGVLEQIMSDNGPQFISTDSAEFTKINGIKHTRSLPCHPVMNGEAERFVHTFKDTTKTGKGDGLTGGEFLQWCQHLSY